MIRFVDLLSFDFHSSQRHAGHNRLEGGCELDVCASLSQLLYQSNQLVRRSCPIAIKRGSS